MVRGVATPVANRCEFPLSCVDPEGNGYQRSASPANAANKDDRSSMPNVAESQPAAKGYEVLVDVINTGQVSVTGHKNADNRGAQGSGSTQKQSALTASESGDPASPANKGTTNGADDWKVGGMISCKSYLP